MKILSIAILIILTGCGKSDDIAPVIVVTSPTSNQVYNGGQTVNIKANITDNTDLHMIHLSVTDNTTGGHLVHLEEHPDVEAYNLNHTFIAVSGRSYTIDIDATDHNENISKKDLTVSAN